MDHHPATDRRPLLLCFSHLRWDFVTQRPQHLLKRAARTHRVVYWEEPHFAGPGDTDTPRLELHPQPSGVTVAVPVLPGGWEDAVADVAQRSLLDGFLGGATPAVAWFYTPMAMPFAAHLDADVTVYDCMDELSAFDGAPPRLLRLERELLARADLVFTGGRSLYEAKRDRHRGVHCFPSSIEAEHFARARDAAAGEPGDQTAIGRPRIGFFGVVDERMDLPLLAQVAALRPDWQFVMIGPVVKIDPASLPQAANLHWLGGRAYADLPAYLSGWDAGLMPFARNAATRFISPTKTPEYLAAGIPVVSTPITDVVRPWGEADLVGIAGDAPGLVAALQQALSRRHGPAREAWLARVDATLRQQSWDLTWAGMLGLIRQATRRPLPARVGVAKPAVRSTVARTSGVAVGGTSHV